MSMTTNYGLRLCNDDSKRFKEWREEINGVTDSNMVKIDQILKSFESALLTSVNLYNIVLDGWESDSTIEQNHLWCSAKIDGIDKAKSVFVVMPDNTTDIQKAAWINHNIHVSSTFRPVYPGSTGEDMSDTLFFVSKYHSGISFEGIEHLNALAIPVTIIAFS